MICIPAAGAHKYGHAGQGLLNLKSEKIKLVGLKLLKSLFGLSDHTHPSPEREERWLWMHPGVGIVMGPLHCPWK